MLQSEILPLPQLLTAREAAALLRTSVDTVYREWACGRLGFVPIRGRRRTTDRMIADYIEAQSRWPKKSIELAKTTFSANEGTVISGALAGSMHVLDRQSAIASAQRTFSKRR